MSSAPVRIEGPDGGAGGGGHPYASLALLVLFVGLLGYAGYELYPRFDLPGVEGAALLALAAGAGIASFFSPCAFPLLLTLLGREAAAGTSPFRFASALSAGATAFLLLLGGMIALGGRTLVGDVVFTSPEGRILRLAVGLFLVLMGLVQWSVIPNPLHAAGDALPPLARAPTERDRTRPFLGHVSFGFGYLLAGFG